MFWQGKISHCFSSRFGNLFLVLKKMLEKFLFLRNLTREIINF